MHSCFAVVKEPQNIYNSLVTLIIISQRFDVVLPCRYCDVAQTLKSTHSVTPGGEKVKVKLTSKFSVSLWTLSSMFGDVLVFHHNICNMKRRKQH